MNTEELERQASERVKELAGDKKLFWYGLKFRPFTIGTVPSNHVSVVFLDEDLAKAYMPDKDKNNSIRHGAVAYSHELPERDMSSYELIDLSKIGITDELTEDDIIAYTEALAFQVLKEEGGKIDDDRRYELLTYFYENPGDFTKKRMKKVPAFTERRSNPAAYDKLMKFIDYAKSGEIASFELEEAMNKVSAGPEMTYG